MSPDSRSGTARIALGGRVLTAAIMLGIFAVMTLMALGLPAKARMMPLLAGVPGTLLGLVCLVAEWRTAVEEAALERAEAQRAERQMLCWTLLFFLGILACGFLYAAPVLVFAFLSIGKREPLATGLLGAAATWAVLYGLFEVAFRIPLFEGLAVAFVLG